MTCAEARERMLEAEPGELRPDARGPLAEHIAACSSCAAAAEQILVLESALGEHLSRVPHLDPAEIVARAGSGRRPVRRPAPARRVAHGRRRQLWLTVAAAAALAGVLLWPRPPRSLPGTPVSVPRLDPPAVEAPVGRDLAVLRTSNPDITVLWFF